MYSKMAMNWKQTHASFISNNRGEREKEGENTIEARRDRKNTN